MFDLNSFGYEGLVDWASDRWDSVEGWFDGSTAANRQQRENEHNTILQYFANKALQEQSQEFNASQSALAFQRSLSAYRQRYQDTVKDLRSAGLNPLLSVQGMSPGTTPSATPASSSAASVGLPSASLSQGADVIGSISNLVGAYTGLRTLGASLANSAADTAMKESSVELNKARALEASAAAAHQMVETEDPGVIGQGYRALKSIGSQWAANTRDMIDSISSDHTELVDNASSALSAKNAAKSEEDISSALNKRLESLKKDSTLGDKKSLEIRLRHARDRELQKLKH